MQVQEKRKQLCKHLNFSPQARHFPDCSPLLTGQHLPSKAAMLNSEAHSPQNHYDPLDQKRVSTTSLFPLEATHYFTANSTITPQPPGCWGRKAVAGGEARLPGHRLRDGPRTHGHLDPFLPLLSPGICQHIVLIRVQLVGIMQLHSSDQVGPKHLEWERKGH